ncbi:hypothetical protein M231_07574 [Tremella mesenterica]|uniref:MAGE domain-containing protein n=1 Tax=Tremella mesenterica TaxID=5217 RepID=A0A4Q1B913_TREME|nr:hypothetical protein M231_07574 [Tremella mesenterica]
MAPKRPAAGSSTQANQKRRKESTSSESEGDAAPSTSTQTGKSGTSSNTLKTAAAKLVRMALFAEYRTLPLRRDQTARSVIPSDVRAFPAVLDRAQTTLRTKFGMELVELRSRHKGNMFVSGDTQSVQTQTQTQIAKKKGRPSLAAIQEESEDEGEGEQPQTQAATQAKKTTTGTKTYVLRSVLPAELLAHMSIPDPLPLRDDDERVENEKPDSGALLRWEKAAGTVSAHPALLGVRTVVLCLVLCLGRVVGDDHLHALLRRLNLQRDTLLPFTSPDSKESYLTLDKYLDLLSKQNYLEKIKLPSTGGPSEQTYEWRWGSRESEFSEKDAAKFIADILIDENQDDDDEPRRTRNATRGEERPSAVDQRKRLRTDIERSAGGPLMGDDW